VSIGLITQPSLLEVTSPQSDDLGLDTVSRTLLDDCCWFDLHRGWLAEPDTLFGELVETLDWHHTERSMFDKWVTDPRLGASVRRPTGSLLSARRRLEHSYGCSFGALWCNLYRDGSDGVSWHGDRDGQRPVDEVAIISLGGSRTFRIRPNRGGSGRSIELHSGDLLVMGGRMQAHFEHSIPKRAIAHARISVTLRDSTVGSADRRARRRPHNVVTP
jgi:hypothetical protein